MKRDPRTVANAINIKVAAILANGGKLGVGNNIPPGYATQPIIGQLLEEFTKEELNTALYSEAGHYSSKGRKKHGLTSGFYDNTGNPNFIPPAKELVNYGKQILAGIPNVSKRQLADSAGESKPSLMTALFGSAGESTLIETAGESNLTDFAGESSPNMTGMRFMQGPEGQVNSAHVLQSLNLAQNRFRMFVPPVIQGAMDMFSLWNKQQPQANTTLPTGMPGLGDKISSAGAMARQATSAPQPSAVAPSAPIDPFAGLTPQFPGQDIMSRGYFNNQQYEAPDQFYRLPDGRYVNKIAYAMEQQANQSRGRDGVYR